MNKEWIYGRNPVFEVLRADRRHAYRLLVADGAQKKGRLDNIIELCKQKGIAIETLPRVDLDRLQPGNQGVLLEASLYPYATLSDILDLSRQRAEPPLILILDTLQDPQNLGTLLRTAETVGTHGVLLPLRRTATVSPAVVNASSGASEHLLTTQVNLAQAITTLKGDGVWVVGLDSGPEAQVIDKKVFRGALALVVGGEDQGMRRLVRQSCDLLMKLPMRGKIDSLNAAVAGSITLFLAWEERGFNLR
jgi:23S rRNA (guanosine2251-2'-O)-methyltransferase